MIQVPLGELEHAEKGSLTWGWMGRCGRVEGRKGVFRSGQRRLLSWTLEITKELGQPSVGWGTVQDKPLV